MRAAGSGGVEPEAAQNSLASREAERSIETQADLKVRLYEERGPLRQKRAVQDSRNALVIG